MKLRITPQGHVHALWSDVIDWPALGPLQIRRASHVEFCSQRQQWYVQAARPDAWWRRLLQAVLRRPCGEILHYSLSRQAALMWESKHFAPGGTAWRVSTPPHHR